MIVILTIPVTLWSQEKKVTAGGFIRSGVYLSTDDYEHNINTVFGDAALNLTATDNVSFKGFTDLRARLGQQFGENADNIFLREAWGMYYNDIFSFSIGKKIVKWGKTDFFTPLSKFNPSDNLFRSPDREDTDMGNLLAEIKFSLSPDIRFSIVTAPLWNPSILMTKPLKLPDYVKIDFPMGLQAGNKSFSYGVRGDFTLKGTDIGIQWYHGPDQMPGLLLTGANLTNPDSILMKMTGVPYNTSCAGVDFEAVIKSIVARGALSYSKPVREKGGNEEIPFPQIEWVTGIDWTPGSLRFIAEYTGKKVLEYYEPTVESLIGQEIDFMQLAQQLALSGLDPNEFARMQTEGFNRLYNSQLKEYYHSAGLRIEVETLYGKLTPSLSTVYNFTSKDLALIPKVVFKPADGVALTGGLEYYSGIDKSMFDLIEEFMSSVFFSLRIDF